MGDDENTEAAWSAPANRELTWACYSSGELPHVFYADADVSHFPDTVCVRLDRLELTAKTAYYVVKGLRELRNKVETIVLP